MISVTDFHTVVFDYLTESINRKEFTLRFASLLSGIEKDGEPSAIKLANAMYSHLVLAIAGAIDEGDLRSRLAEQARIVEVYPKYRVKEPSLVQDPKKSPSSLPSPAEAELAFS
jgi:hypothetical protein